MYRPAAFYLAQVVMDVPFALFQGMQCDDNAILITHGLTMDLF